MIGYIYKIENPSGKIYIGKTTDMNTRMNKYRYLNCNNQKRLHSSLLKYGWNAHTVDVIDTVLIFDDNLDILERYYINHYDSYHKGLNCTLGGEWEADSMIELATISPLSIATLVRLKAGRTGKKVKSIYNLEYN
jgi:group I intron endonuclease